MSDIKRHLGHRIEAQIPGAGATLLEKKTIEGQQISRYDVNGDGQADVVVNEHAGGTSVRGSEGGDQFILWGDPQGRIYWTQQWGAGRFENAFDHDRDGVVDYLARGIEGGAFDVFKGEAAVKAAKSARSGQAAPPEEILGVAPSLLSMPHAVLSAGDIRLTWHEDIEKADVTVRVAFSSFVPPLASTVKGAAPISDWAGEEQKFAADATGFTLTVRGTSGAAWLGNAPTLKLELADGSTQPIALFAKKMTVDDSRPTRVGLEQSLDSAEKTRKLLEAQLDSVSEKLRFPEKHLHAYSELGALQAEQDQLQLDLDALRPEARSAVNADLLGTVLSELAQNAVLAERFDGAVAQASSLAQSGAATEAVLDYLGAAGALDVVLARATGGSFAAKAERLYVIEAFDLRQVEKTYGEDRAAFVAEHSKFRLGLRDQLAENKTHREQWAKQLLALAGDTAYHASSAHEPYTF